MVDLRRMSLCSPPARRWRPCASARTSVVRQGTPPFRHGLQRSMNFPGGACPSTADAGFRPRPVRDPGPPTACLLLSEIYGTRRRAARLDDHPWWKIASCNDQREIEANDRNRNTCNQHVLERQPHITIRQRCAARSVSARERPREWRCRCCARSRSHFPIRASRPLSRSGRTSLIVARSAPNHLFHAMYARCCFRVERE